MSAIANGRRLDAADVKAAATGRGLEILEHVAGIPADRLDGKHGPCPRPECGGLDRARLIDAADGVFYCSKCFDKKNGDVLSAVMHYRGVAFPEALRLVADYLGIGHGNGHTAPQFPPLEAVARAKGITVESLVAYGAREMNGRVELPAYDADGQQCTTFTISAAPGASEKERKGLFSSNKDGQHPAGIFLPHGDEGGVRLPRPGETWLVVEGFKDAARLWEMGFLAVGLNTSSLNAKFARLLAGCDVVLVPDRDKAGAEGAVKTTAALWGVAKSIKLAALPAPFTETGGADVRDCCKRPDGEAQVRKCIEAARPLNEKGEPRDLPRLAARNLTELLGGFPRLRPPLIHGLLRRGETMNIIAETKVGKSWLTQDLAFHVTSGRSWFGRFQCELGRVLILDNELHPETIAHRLPRISAAREIDPLDVAERMLIDNVRGKSVNVGNLDEYLADVRPGDFDLIICDAWYRFLAIENENDNAAMAGAYNTLDKVASRLSCSFLLVHHSSKGSQAGKRVTDVGSGAGAQSRAADTHLVLREHKEPGVIVVDAAVRS